MAKLRLLVGILLLMTFLTSNVQAVLIVWAPPEDGCLIDDICIDGGKCEGGGGYQDEMPRFTRGEIGHPCPPGWCVVYCA